MVAATSSLSKFLFLEAAYLRKPTRPDLWGMTYITLCLLESKWSILIPTLSTYAVTQVKFSLDWDRGGHNSSSLLRTRFWMPLYCLTPWANPHSEQQPMWHIIHLAWIKGNERYFSCQQTLMNCLEEEQNCNEESVKSFLSKLEKGFLPSSTDWERLGTSPPWQWQVRLLRKTLTCLSTQIPSVCDALSDEIIWTAKQTNTVLLHCPHKDTHSANIFTTSIWRNNQKEKKKGKRNSLEKRQSMSSD